MTHYSYYGVQSLKFKVQCCVTTITTNGMWQKSHGDQGPGGLPYMPIEWIQMILALYRLVSLPYMPTERIQMILALYGMASLIQNKANSDRDAGLCRENHNR